MSEEQITSTRPDIPADQLIVRDEGQFANLFDTARFNQAWRIATAFSRSKLVPAHFQASPENCFIALDMALRMDLHPFMLMQKLYIVHGRPGMEAQMVIALVNARGPFKGPIQWEVSGEGDNRQWTAYAIHRETGERCEATITMQMVKAEGWLSKDGSKWRTLPDLMGRYRSAVFLARLYCPEVILGMSTVDELQDINGDVVELQPEPPVIDKKPLADKIKEELQVKKQRKPRSDAGTKRTPSADPLVTPSPTQENASTGVSGLLSADQGRRIEELLKDPVVIDAGYSKATICHEWEVLGIEHLNPEQADNVIRRLEKVQAGEE